MTKPTTRDIENIADRCQDAFWAAVAKETKKYGIKSGDLSPEDQGKFSAACFIAVREWLYGNMNESTELSESGRISDDPKYATHKSGKDLYKKMNAAGGIVWHKWSDRMKIWTFLGHGDHPRDLPKDIKEIPNAPKLRAGYNKNGIFDLIPESSFAIKSFERFLAEAGGETGWSVEVHKTDLKKARVVVAEQLAKKHRDLDETIPDFDKNYQLLRKAVDGAWGVMRRDMPVINDNQIAEFQKLLKDGALDILKPFAKGHMLTDKEVQQLDDKSDFVHLGFKDGKDNDDRMNAKLTHWPVKKLKPIQTQIFLDKTADMIAQWGPATQGSPVTKLTLIISKEGYILDGHHRFSCAMLSDPNLQMSVLEVPMPIDDLLKLTLSYGDAIGNKRNG